VRCRRISKDIASLQTINFTGQPVAYYAEHQVVIRVKAAMDDGHGKLPLVVLNSTTMASSAVTNIRPVNEIENRKKFNSIRMSVSEFLDVRRTSLNRKNKLYK